LTLGRKDLRGDCSSCNDWLEQQSGISSGHMTKLSLLRLIFQFTVFPDSLCSAETCISLGDTVKSLRPHNIFPVIFYMSIKLINACVSVTIKVTYMGTIIVYEVWVLIW
jgi:hypothetical protein